MSEEPTAKHPIIRSPTVISRGATTWTAPWSPEQVAQLSAYQRGGYGHPYTCGTDSKHPKLVPSKMGWHCVACDYTQDWALAVVTAPTIQSHHVVQETMVDKHYLDSLADDVMLLQIPKRPDNRVHNHNDLCGLSVSLTMGKETFEGTVFAAYDMGTHYRVTSTAHRTETNHHTMMVPISTHKRRAEPKPIDNIFLIIFAAGMVVAVLAAIAMIALYTTSGIFDSSAELTRIP